MKALVGYSGFVGGHLQKWVNFDALYNSKNFSDAKQKSFDLMVFSASRAEKWKSNANPQEDLEHIESLISVLREVHAKKFILISTIDVYPDVSSEQSERWIDQAESNHAYGRNRAILENFVRGHFDNYSIVRLPGLFGSGLKKNAIFDFLTNNEVRKIDSRGSFQFYDLELLTRDLDKICDKNLELVNLFTEPITVEEICKFCFEIDFINHVADRPASYNLTSEFAPLWGSQSKYLYSKQDVLERIRRFVDYWRLAGGSK